MGVLSIVEKNTQKLKNMYQVNYAQALSKMKHEIVKLLIVPKIDLKNLLGKIIIYMSKTLEIVRKGRSFNRKQNWKKNNIVYPSYVSCL